MSRKTRRSRRGAVLILVTLLLAGALVLWNRAGDTSAAVVGTTEAPPSGSVLSEAVPSEAVPSESAPLESAPSVSASSADTEEGAEEPADEGTGEDVAQTPSQP